MDLWMDGWMDGWIDGWKDGRERSVLLKLFSIAKTIQRLVYMNGM
jgi:hypothetical protein